MTKENKGTKCKTCKAVMYMEKNKLIQCMGCGRLIDIKGQAIKEGDISFALMH